MKFFQIPDQQKGKAIADCLNDQVFDFEFHCDSDCRVSNNHVQIWVKIPSNIQFEQQWTMKPSDDMVE